MLAHGSWMASAGVITLSPLFLFGCETTHRFENYCLDIRMSPWYSIWLSGQYTCSLFIETWLTLTNTTHWSMLKNNGPMMKKREVSLQPGSLIRLKSIQAVHERKRLTKNSFSERTVKSQDRVLPCVPKLEHLTERSFDRWHSPLQDIH